MHISELETILKLVTHKNFGDREGWGYQLKTDHYTIEAHVSSNDLLNEVWVTKRFPDSVEGDYIIEMLLGIFKSVGIFESVITKKDGFIIYIDNTQQTFVEVLREMSLEYPLISKKHNA